MESNTINRVVVSGTVFKKPIKREIVVGNRRELLAAIMLKQADPRKKEIEDKQRVNLFVVKGIGDAAKSLVALEAGQNVIVRGMLQARIKKGEKEAEASKILPYIFVPDGDGVQLATGPNLVNEVSLFGKIFIGKKIASKIHISDEEHYAHVAFAMQVGETKKNENPFADTEPVNLVFVKYKPKNVEGFKKIKDRFNDKGRFVAVTGALISENAKVYRLEVIARQLVVLPGKFVKIQEVSPEKIFQNI